MEKKNNSIQILSVMLCFFTMGFVDLVGTASNYVQKDLALSDSQANLFPSLVFFWFLIFSIPTGILMNKIGRKNTVLVSLVITVLSLILPTFWNGYYTMLMSFSLLGIGNAFMQTSLNPLVSNLINSKHLASTLTFGQFVKAIASLLAPVFASYGAIHCMTVFNLGWRILFPIYVLINVIAIFALYTTKIKEEAPDSITGFVECLRILGKPFILLCFIGIMCHVGIDVGTNTIAPKIVMEKTGAPLEEAGWATSLYFIFRTTGCLLGAMILRKMSSKIFFAISSLMMLVAVLMLVSCDSIFAIYTVIALIGFGNSNIFSIIFAQALNNSPDEKNKVSGLMIMGLFGGAIFPFIMGYASDFFNGQIGAVATMSVGVLYLIGYTLKIKK